MKESASWSQSHITAMTWSLLAIMPLIGMAVDLVAPSLPSIASNLNLAHHTAKNIISVYLLGYGLGNFFTGFLTDAWGRKHLLRINLFLFIIISLIPIFIPHAISLLLARFFQGVTLGAVAVLIRAIFADILPSEKLTSLGTLIGTMWGIGPVLGPIIGGYLQFYFGWQACFYFFAIISTLAFLITFFIVPETHIHYQTLEFKTIKNNLSEVLSHRLFMGLVLIMGFAFSLVIIFNTAGPFLIQNEFHYSPIFFGHVAFLLGIAYLGSTICCRWALKKFSFEYLFPLALHFFFFAALILTFISYYFPTSVFLTILASLVMYFACGFIFPMSIGKGLSLFRQMAGTAGATMYLVNMLIPTLVSFVVNLIMIENNIPLLIMYSSLFLISSIIYWLVVKNKS